MGGDADFEHARLLKIHTSVVVSARSVMGIFDFGPGEHFVIPLGFRGGFCVCLLILFFHTKYPTTSLLTGLYISTPGGYLLLFNIRLKPAKSRLFCI